MGETPHGQSPDGSHGFPAYDCSAMKDNAPSPTAEPVSTGAQCGTKPRQRILVVDDDISIRQLNTDILLRGGYEVDSAEDGAAAWEALCADSYDLLITDNNMPKLSGVELLKRLRAARMALPVIMATGSWPREDFTRHPWLQPEVTLLKPYAIEEMLRTVEEALRATAATPSNCVTHNPAKPTTVD